MILPDLRAADSHLRAHPRKPAGMVSTGEAFASIDEKSSQLDTDDPSTPKKQ
jgi:hypothetical protein